MAAHLRAYIESLLDANTAPSTRQLYAAVKGICNTGFIASTDVCW